MNASYDSISAIDPLCVCVCVRLIAHRTLLCYLSLSAHALVSIMPHQFPTH